MSPVLQHLGERKIRQQQRQRVHPPLYECVTGRLTCQILPAPLEAESGPLFLKAANQKLPLPCTSLGRPCSTNQLSVVLAQPAIGINRGPDIGFFAIEGRQHVAEPWFTLHLMQQTPYFLDEQLLFELHGTRYPRSDNMAPGPLSR